MPSRFQHQFHIYPKVTEETFRSLIFGDFIEPDALPEDRCYEEVVNIEVMYPIAEQCLLEYNATRKTKMNLVIFRYSVSTLLRASRVEKYSF